MAAAPNLPTDVAPGDPDHAGLHNDVNASVNTLAETSTLAVAHPTGTLVYGDLTRVGRVVHFACGVDNNSGGGSVTALIPTGYRPPDSPSSGVGSFISGYDTNADTLGTMRVFSTGDIAVIGPASEAWLFGGTWITDDPAPA